jgi:hypothetical protein
MNRKNFLLMLLSVMAVVGSFQANAAIIDITINPTSDGALYTCSGCNTVSDGQYLLSSGYIQGAAKFSTSTIAGAVTKAFLTVNPYGLPLWDKTVDIYAYGTEIGQLVKADANAGTFLGTMILPDDLGYGKDAYFEVTNFLASLTNTYAAFNLRSSGTNTFSSLEYNYGHPAQLKVSYDVPEPSAIFLLLCGLSFIGVFRKRVQKLSV